MTRENRDISYETRDTHNRGIAMMGFWTLVICGITSLLMIPLTHYLWDLSRTPEKIKTQQSKTPVVVLEVLPSQEQKKLTDEVQSTQAHDQIDQAMKKALDQGFPVKS